MQIKDIFEKPIARPINGVVKAEQLDESIVWQELDEYVVTRELDQHLRKFVSAYLTSIDNAHDPVVASRMGVWVSGFFGSGKSHFIKILSYLLCNRLTVDAETATEKMAVDFFNDKIRDPMLLGDLKRIAGIETDVILFNIDSKADSSDGRSAVLSTFWRVFNECQGFCGDYLSLAEIERYLTQKGKYETFKEKFFKSHGAQWDEERDAYSLYQDEIVGILSDVLETSQQAANDWFEKQETEFKLTVDNFAKRIKEYLDSKSNTHRIVFLVDEIGQFIGEDTHLMLNLQTIVEDLGRICNGRVWVLVTSQEDIDAIIQNLKASKANDFSKIQGRFYTRLSLSSSNTDEVIQARLLEKTKPAQSELEDLFDKKGDILKSQLGFSHDSTTLKNFTDAAAFSAHYPFTPFHFQLVQSIFESIRKAGATGLHLARGERSMLDAFQSAAISLSPKETGALVPLYEFFPCIENFLDTAVILSINNAKENASLEMPFDLHMLQTLFLIRYVELIKPNVDNLVTLCIDQVDADRIDLKQKIVLSLERLEKQNLISRNGDHYYFLTNDEREVSREIKSVSIEPTAESKLLGDILFEDVLKNKTKHRYMPYKNDYPFNRICDSRIWGKDVSDGLGLEIISPLHDEYEAFIPAKCNLYSASKEGHVIAKLSDDKDLIGEIRTYLQTDSYIHNKSNPSASDNLRRILKDRADENRDRRERLVTKLEAMLSGAEFYALGKSIDIKGATTSKVLDQAFDHLVKNVFNKYDYLSHQFDEPLKEIKQILLFDDISQQQLALDFENAEPMDVKEVRTFIDLMTAKNHSIVLSDLVQHFSGRPYGWGDLQVVVLIAKLFMAGNIVLDQDGKLSPKDAIAPLTKTPQWKSVKILKRPKLPEVEIKKAQALGKELFGSIAPDGQDPLVNFLRQGLSQWAERLQQYKPLADTGNYPGKNEIDDCLAITHSLKKVHDSYELVKAFNAKKEELADTSDDLDELDDFYTNQRSTWETLQKAMDRFKVNRNDLEKHDEAGKALKRLFQILDAPSPYGMLKDVNGLVSTVEKANDELIEKRREAASQDVETIIDQVSTLLKENKADPDFSNKALYPLQEIKKKIQSEYSIPQIITYSVHDAQEQYEEALAVIEDQFKPKTDTDPKPKPIKTIKPAKLKQKAYLETEADVDAFLEKIREALMEALESNNRVRIE